MLDPENYVALLLPFARGLGELRDAGVPDALSKVLGAQPNTREFYRRVVALGELAHRARAQLDEVADDHSHSLYREALDPIVSVFSNLDARVNWNQHAHAFGTRALTLLETCARAIDARLTQKPPTREVAAKVLDSVRKAADEVLASDLEGDAKQVLMEMLREVEWALLCYDISGLAGLRRAVERTVGAAVFNQEAVAAARSHSAGKKALNTLGMAVSLVRNVEYVKQLAERVGPYILPFLGQ